jgi:multiple sugar transport system permease protein
MTRQPGTTKRLTLAPLWFLLPNLLGFLVFAAFPVVFSLGMSFTDWSLKASAGANWVGLRNYGDLLHDARFWKYLHNTAYLMLALPVAVIGSLALALLLNSHLPADPRRRRGVIGLGVCLVGGAITVALAWSLGRPNAGIALAVLWLVAGLGLAFNVVAYRTIYYLPTFVSGVALMILWKALYNPQTGPINAGLAWRTGLPMDALPKWLSSATWAKPSLMLMNVWIMVGGTNMLLYLAALSNLSPDMLDAAAVDGASAWQRVRHIIVPAVAPTTFFICITSFIGGIQGGFEQARVMTQGGPDGATTTLSYYVYNLAFQDLNLGYAAAVSWVMFAGIFVVTALNWRFGKNLEAD